LFRFLFFLKTFNIGRQDIENPKKSPAYPVISQFAAFQRDRMEGVFADLRVLNPRVNPLPFYLRIDENLGKLKMDYAQIKEKFLHPLI
jgi:hypothetical protein